MSNEDEPDGQTKEQGITLHARLVAGDVTAPAEIAEAFLPGLVARLKRANPSVENLHDYETAAEDALMSYLKRPEQFDPNRLSMMSFLLMAAKRDLLNLLRPKAIEAHTQSLMDVVELGQPGSEQIDEPYFVAPADRTQTTDPYFWEQVRALVPDPQDQRIVALIVHGVRETDAYSEVLGISGLERDQREAEVKRVKDRLQRIEERVTARLRHGIFSGFASASSSSGRTG